MRSNEFLLTENNVGSELTPGEKRDLEIKITDLRKLSNSIDQQLSQFAELNQLDAPSYSIKKKFEKLKDAVKKEILELEAQLRHATTTDKADNDAKINQLLDTIERECSDFVSAVKKTKKFLYRGVKDSPTSFIGKTRDNRKSKDSASFSQEIFDIFLKAFGFKAGRGSSIFCSTRAGQASGYGSVYYIFPVNGYEFLYTSNDDLIMGHDYWEHYIRPEMAKKFLTELRTWIYDNEPEIKDDDYNGRFSYLKGYIADLDNVPDYRFKNLVNDMKNETPMYVIEELPENLRIRTPIVFAKMLDGNKVFRDLRPNSTDIEHYLENRTGEINISGVYYALKKSEFKDYVEAKFAGVIKSDEDDSDY